MKEIQLDEINTILSDTLRQVMNKEISLKKAGMIAKIAGTLSKNIANADFQKRIDLLETTLMNRK